MNTQTTILTAEQKLFSAVGDLIRLRNIPQLIYISGVSYESFVAVRTQIRDYRARGGVADEIDVIIQSPGGLPDYAYRTIRYLREEFTTVNFIIPFWVKSAGTLMALGATKMYFGSCGELGPLDMQVGVPYEDRPGFEFESALTDDNTLRQIEERSLFQYTYAYYSIYNNEEISINKNELSRQLFDFYAKFYAPLLEQVNPYKVGQKSRSLTMGRDYASKVLRFYGPEDLTDEMRETLVDKLVRDYSDHAFVLDFITVKDYFSNAKEAKDLGEDYKDALENLVDVTLILNPNKKYLVLLDPEALKALSAKLQEELKRKNATPTPDPDVTDNTTTTDSDHNSTTQQKNDEEFSSPNADDSNGPPAAAEEDGGTSNKEKSGGRTSTS